MENGRQAQVSTRCVNFAKVTEGLQFEHDSGLEAGGWEATRNLEITLLFYQTLAIVHAYMMTPVLNLEGGTVVSSLERKRPA